MDLPACGKVHCARQVRTVSRKAPMRVPYRLKAFSMTFHPIIHSHHASYLAACDLCNLQTLHLGTHARGTIDHKEGQKVTRTPDLHKVDAERSEWILGIFACGAPDISLHCLLQQPVPISRT